MNEPDAELTSEKEREEAKKNGTRMNKKNRRQSMASVETMVSVMCFTLVHSNTSLYSYFRLGFVRILSLFFAVVARLAAKSGEQHTAPTRYENVYV